MRSNGLVVVIPSYPIAYDGAQQMGRAWFDLQSVFSQADQCVQVVDAVTALILSDSESAAPELGYLSRRLAESADPEVARQLIQSGFGAFTSRRRGTEADLETRIGQIPLVLESDQPAWVRSVVASTGLFVDDVKHLGERLDGQLPSSGDLLPWRDWTVEVLRSRPEILETTLRSGSRAVFKGAPAEIGIVWERLQGNRLVEATTNLLEDWMGGFTLQELEARGIELGLIRRATQHCEFARKFVLRVIPDLSYAFALPLLVAKRRDLAVAVESAPFNALPTAVELGVDSMAKLDYLRASVLRTRMSAHRDVN